MPRCPVCRREFKAEESKAMPFCSERCRVIDLGRWLDEKYSVPDEGETPEEGEGEPPSQSGGE
ncbi:MAG: DNA gyrase inhibitor YacG [Planctomycetaceae bacterium]|nr:DNA gyrase inhibitor YacG [Planctomycetaceae bacterium]